MNRTAFLFPRLFVAWSATVVASFAAEASDPVAAWRTHATVRPLLPAVPRHTLHAYYLTNPESPDGKRVLFYASTTPDGHRGDLVVLERATGKETVIARGIDTEDAHRAACQQWVSNGARVAYHDVKADRWSVHVVTLATGEDKVLARDRQLCFGRAIDDLVPLYGCHWNPGVHRDLELLNAATGEIKTVVTIADVERRWGDWLKKEFGDRTTSIFFPNISPDGRRVFFKMSAPGPQGALNNFRSGEASKRQGTVVYDIASGKPVFMRQQWGHPAWHPDSKHIIEAGALIFDLEAEGKMAKIPDLPQLPGDHPSVSPDGKLIVKDGPLTNLGGAPGEWGVMVSDIRGGSHHIIARFENRRGAKSWRKNHPHPIFSADGRRIYFNENADDWTTLYVAELRG